MVWGEECMNNMNRHHLPLLLVSELFPVLPQNSDGLNSPLDYLLFFASSITGLYFASILLSFWNWWPYNFIPLPTPLHLNIFHKHVKSYVWVSKDKKDSAMGRKEMETKFKYKIKKKRYSEYNRSKVLHFKCAS